MLLTNVGFYFQFFQLTRQYQPTQNVESLEVFPTELKYCQYKGCAFAKSCQQIKETRHDDRFIWPLLNVEEGGGPYIKLTFNSYKISF